MLADWLPRYEGEHCKIDAKLRKKILSISAVQIDWFLAPRKLRFGNRGSCGIGASGEPRKPVATAIRRINALRAAEGRMGSGVGNPQRPRVRSLRAGRRHRRHGRCPHRRRRPPRPRKIPPPIRKTCRLALRTRRLYLPPLRSPLKNLRAATRLLLGVMAGRIRR